MPPKKRECFGHERILRKKREVERMKRLRETAEERERRLSINRNRTALSRAQRRDSTLCDSTQEFQVKMCQELYETVRNYRNEEGRQICRSFIRAPNRCMVTDYHDIVTKPMDLLKIQQKLQAKEYKDSQQFTSDMELLVNNAKSYYKEDSQEYCDACELWKLFSDEKICKEKQIICEIQNKEATLKKEAELKKIRSAAAKKGRNKQHADPMNTESDPEPGDTEYNQQWQLYNTVKNYTSWRGILSELFWKLPDKRRYADCFKQKMKHISLSRIHTKIKEHKYSSVLRLAADMNRMFKYAKMYNAADSKIFKAATVLEKLVQDKSNKRITHLKPIPKKSLLQCPTKKEAETTMDYVFEGKCKKCNFSDMQIWSEATDSCNTVTVIKCTLCFSTKLIGMEDPKNKSTHLESQALLNGFQQVTSIKEELILPDDAENHFSLDLNSEPTLVEMTFSVDQDQNTTEPGSVPFDTRTPMDIYDRNTATPVPNPVTVPTPVPTPTPVSTPTSVFAPTQINFRRFSVKKSTQTPSSSNSDTFAELFVPLLSPQDTIRIREPPNHPKCLLVGKKKALVHCPSQVQEQPFEAQQVSSVAQSQLTVNSQVLVPMISQLQAPVIDVPQVVQIKEEIILPD